LNSSLAANRIITLLTYGYSETNINYIYDINKAETLLNVSGYKTDELNLEVYYYNDTKHENMAKEIKSYWEALDQVNTVIFKVLLVKNIQLD